MKTTEEVITEFRELFVEQEYTNIKGLIAEDLEQFIREVSERVREETIEEVINNMLSDFKYIDVDRNIEGMPTFKIYKEYFYNKLKSNKPEEKL